VATAADLLSLFRRSGASKKGPLSVLADDMACALLPLSSVVSVLFYALLYNDPLSVVEPGLRPAWLSPAMHGLNSVAAWADFAVCGPRAFSRRAAVATVALAACYGVWIQVVKLKFGSFPYPFLNTLPHPRASVIATAGAVALNALIFAAARALSKLVFLPARRGAAKAGSRPLVSSRARRTKLA